MTVEELTCLATWKDGNSRYLVGLVSHHHATSNEERYRCFVYEKITGSGSSKEAEYKLAQSGDATCNGLDSAEVGSRIMTLRKAPAADRCDFPQWFKGTQALALDIGQLRVRVPPERRFDAHHEIERRAGDARTLRTD